MKKTISLLLMAVLSATAMSQRKSVAILETYCAEDNIGKAYLIMIGSNIETGIINNPQYTAYNRAQIQAIIKEHHFQTSGMVNDSEVRRLGQMAGVDYVLASEAALVGQQVFVTAKVLNVETGSYEMSANALMDFNPAAIQTGCENLAVDLLNGGKKPKAGKIVHTPATSNPIAGREEGLPQPNREIAVKSGLLAYWNFDDENIHDAMSDKFHGTVIGKASFINETPNGYGKAISLKSTNQNKIVIPYDILPEIYTICFWAKDFGTGLFYTENDAVGRGLACDKNGKMLVYLCHPYEFDYNNNDVQSSEWHHYSLCSTKDIYNVYVYLYIDGVKVDELSIPLNNYWVQTGKLSFGGSRSNNSSSNRGFAPSMSISFDNIRLYSRALNNEEISEIYNSEKTH